MENKTEQRRRIMEKYSYLDGEKEEIKMINEETRLKLMLLCGVSNETITYVTGISDYQIELYKHRICAEKDGRMEI